MKVPPVKLLLATVLWAWVALVVPVVAAPLADPDAASISITEHNDETLPIVPLSTLSGRLRVALGEGPRLALQRSRTDEADLFIDEVRAQRRPQFSLGLEQRSALSNVRQNSFDRGSRLDAVARVTQLLWDFGASGAQLDSATLSAEAERWATLEQAREVVLSALEAYYDVLRHEAQVEQAQVNLRELDRLLEAVSQRTAGGVGGNADMLRARGRQAEASSQLVALEGGLARARNRYVELFFEEPDGLGLPDLPPEPPLSDLASSVAVALEEHPALLESLRRSEAAAASLRAERRGRLPRVTLELQGRQLNVDDIHGEDRSAAVLVNVEYAPYSGGQQGARVGQANERLRQARLERQAIRRELTNAYRSAYTDVIANRQAYQAQKRTVEAEEAAIAGFRSLFSIGRRSLTELLEAQRDVFQSQLLLVDRRVEWDLARYRRMAMETRLLSAFDLEDAVALDLERQ